MGRHLPTVEDEDHERELQVVATKGGINLALILIKIGKIYEGILL